MRRRAPDLRTAVVCAAPPGTPRTGGDLTASCEIRLCCATRRLPCITRGQTGGVTIAVIAPAAVMLAKVSQESQCVGDSDMIYNRSSHPLSGAVCLDYDWTPGPLARPGM